MAARVRIPLGVLDQPGLQFGPVVKWSSRRPVKPEVAGSNPVGTASGRPAPVRNGVAVRLRPTATPQGRVAQSAEHTPEKRGVTGSTPVSTTSAPGRHATCRPVPFMGTGGHRDGGSGQDTLSGSSTLIESVDAWYQCRGTTPFRVQVHSRRRSSPCARSRGRTPFRVQVHSRPGARVAARRRGRTPIRVQVH